MTTTARPLLHALILVSLALAGAWAGHAIFATVWIGFLLFVILIAYMGLVAGLLVIPPAARARRPEKVFCVGLSRTGTTSLSVALHQLGYSTYHMCFKLIHWPDGSHQPPRVDRRWAEAFDAQTDTPVAVGYRELAKLYPSARFILTTRDPMKWGASMSSFYGRYSIIFRYVPFLPTHQILSAAYGEDWATKSPRAYARLYERHVREVRAFFAEIGQPQRLLELAVVDGEGWSKLTAHLEHSPVHDQDFPHVDVFELSWNKQPWWQAQNLVGRLLARGS